MTLISNRTNYTPESSDLRGFLLELFCYFFTIAASTHGNRIKSNDEFAFRVFNSPFLRSHRGRGMLLGAQSEIFYIIFRLSVTLNRYSGSQSNRDSLQLELLSIQSDLSRVIIQHESKQYLQTEESGHFPELQIISSLYYLACQSLLHILMYPGLSVSDEPIRETIRQFFETLERIPLSSSANGVLCWPLFIIGASLNTGKYRSTILMRLRVIETGWRSPIALQASKILTQTWKDCRPAVGPPITSGPSLGVDQLPIILV